MRPWIRSARVAAVIWVAAGLAYFMASMYVWRIAEPQRTLPHFTELIGTWNRFDTIYYVRIAQDGYLFSEYAPAFYPLYPFLIKITDLILPGHGLVAAMAISIFFAFVALVMLHRLVDEEFGEKIASRTVFYLAAFPTGFFLFAAYNESLYITLAIISLYAARKGHFWIASAAAALAGSTRLFGVLLAAPLVYEYMRQRGWSFRKIRWNAVSFLFIPSGVIAFSIFCKIKLNDWLAFSHAQEGWQRRYGWPGEPIWKTIKIMNGSPFLENWRLLGLFELVTMLGAVGLLILAFRGPFKFRRDQYYLLVYTAVPIFLFSCTMAGWPHYLMSAPRIALEWFPLFAVLGMMGASRSFERIYLFIALMAQALMLAPILLKIQFVA
ncbi:mannosyltransferase family protein [Dactylosporangium sp. NPDC048998]|uniref:mannosyltransferase family protein n=1 Tax=Dactylosporangium sp. NPDC048998 TaxID=3363976 RepID=UPI0037190D82